jgi:hypothetical protein
MHLPGCGGCARIGHQLCLWSLTSHGRADVVAHFDWTGAGGDKLRGKDGDDDLRGGPGYNYLDGGSENDPLIGIRMEWEDRLESAN